MVLRLLSWLVFFPVLPQSLIQELAQNPTGGGGLLIFLIEIAILIGIIMGIIVLVQGVRKIPVNYAKQIVGNRQFGGARQFLPMKVNMAGVMPIIFAQAIMFFLLCFHFTESGKGIAKIFGDHSNFWYMIDLRCYGDWLYIPLYGIYLQSKANG